MTVCVDFDGTMVRHKYPAIGEEIPGAVDTIKKLMKDGNQIILWTMRSGAQLQEAVNWCHLKGIQLFNVNNNPNQLVWTTSPKCYAQLYIDDSALGCPLMKDGEDVFVDWRIVQSYLYAAGFLKEPK